MMKRFLKQADVLCGVMLLVSLWLTPGVFAQTTTATEQVDDLIHLIATSTGDSVLLRWAPSNYRIWDQSRRGGLHLQRQTLMRDGQMLSVAERQVVTRLTEAPLVPAPGETFAAIAPDNKYVAIAGQAIYGERFDVGNDEPGKPNFFNRSKEQTNRFSFGLYAADQDWFAANLMGLAFTDRTVKKGEVYVYRLVSADPTVSFDTVQSGFRTVVVNETAPPPRLSEVNTEFGNRTATISWNIENGQQYYTSYFIERSADGLDWKLINRDQLPFVPLFKPEQEPVAFYQDSLPENNRPYFYRVVGRTPFGLRGPASDPSQGMGFDPEPDNAPSFSSVFPTPEGGLQISWTFGQEELAVGFKLDRSNNIDGPYEPITDLLPPDSRVYVDSFPFPSNYYRITVYDQYDRTKTSYPILGQPEDATPPAIPTNLRGLILKDGRVILNWDANEEPDLLGYRLWFSNQSAVEYSLAEAAPIGENYYVGQTTLATLSPKLYAKIVSLDIRHNTSDFSEYIELVRPDTIPPAPPLMTEVQAREDSLIVRWAFSMSLDVEKQELQRQAIGDTAWTVLETYLPPYEDKIYTHIELGLRPGKKYAYRVVATDLSQLTSAAAPVVGAAIDNFIRRPVEDVKATADRRELAINLQWRYEPERDNLSHFEVYRVDNDGDAVIIGHLPATEENSHTYTDAGPLKMDTTYEYQVRAVYDDGGQSPRSERVAVDY